MSSLKHVDKYFCIRRFSSIGTNLGACVRELNLNISRLLALLGFSSMQLVWSITFLDTVV